MKEHLTNQDVRQILTETRENFSIRAFSDKSQYKQWDLVEQKLENGTIIQLQVKGFYLDGEADYETDPSKFKHVTTKEKK